MHIVGALLILATLAMESVSDWPQFRGPNAFGVSDASDLPTEFGPLKNVHWKTPLPAGHSSPTFSPDQIFLTAFDSDHLYVIALERTTGRVLWRREVPRPRKQKLHNSNSPASPSIATDGKNAYAFFTDFGLISYGPDGNERWRVPLGPFDNPFGLASSPVLADGKVIQVCDSESGSFVLAVDQATGAQVWRKERPDMTRGFATPVLYRPPGGQLQALVAGTNRFLAYDVANGAEIWWVRGLTWQMKPTPIVDGDTAYILGWAGGSDQGNQAAIPPFEEILKSADTNHDGKLAKAELDVPYKQDFDDSDLDADGFLEQREWEKYRERKTLINSIMAVKLGGSGDMTERSILWRFYKSLPNVPSPLLYQNVLYMVKEGGILTALDPATGAVLKQGRLKGALDFYYSSPVAADGKIYAASQDGHISVVKAGRDWEILATNDMDDEVFATPAPIGHSLYVR